MAELKTKPNDSSVVAFLGMIEPEQKRKDSFELLEMMKELTGENPKMWGDSIIGFGTYHYKYKTGREGDWFVSGFSPRKQSLTLYLMSGFEGEQELLSKLGKHKTSKGCLYIKKLSDVDRQILRKLVSRSIEKISKYRI
jgi:hypothetical protein